MRRPLVPLVVIAIVATPAALGGFWMPDLPVLVSWSLNTGGWVAYKYHALPAQKYVEVFKNVTGVHRGGGGIALDDTPDSVSAHFWSETGARFVANASDAPRGFDVDFTRARTEGEASLGTYAVPHAEHNVTLVELRLGQVSRWEQEVRMDNATLLGLTSGTSARIYTAADFPARARASADDGGDAFSLVDMGRVSVTFQHAPIIWFWSDVKDAKLAMRGPLTQTCPCEVHGLGRFAAPPGTYTFTADAKGPGRLVLLVADVLIPT